jgi:hypothetical protein
LRLVVVGLVVAGGGCARHEKPVAGSISVAGETVTVSKLRWIASGVCDAAELAGHDIVSARATFYGQSHDGIHLIARGLQTIDRGQSAALLEAKQKVEADLTDLQAGPQVANDLRHLADVTRSSLARYGVTADPCR